MLTRRIAVGLLLLLALFLLTTAVFAAPAFEEPEPVIPPIPPLDDCYCVAEYQANMWIYHPEVPPVAQAAVPAILTMQVNDCQELTEYQANLWQLAQIE